MTSGPSILRPLLQRLRGDDGAAAVSFILTFPIFMLIVAIIVQLALIVTAKIMVSHAADSAARAAMTSLPEEKPENVSKAAWLALAPISPVATTSNPDATDAADALKQLGSDIPESFASRYAYAMEATEVTWTPERRDFVSREGDPVEVEVKYQFKLTVPFAAKLVGGSKENTIAGVTGRFWEVTARRQVQATHGRKAQIDSSYWSR